MIELKNHCHRYLLQDKNYPDRYRLEKNKNRAQSHDIGNEDIDILRKTSKKIIRSYQEFIEFAKFIQINMISCEFIFVKFDNCEYELFVYENSQFIPCILWEPSQIVSEYIDTIFNFSDDVNSHIIACTNKTHFQIGLGWQVMSVLFTRLDLDKQGVPLYTTFKIKKKNGKLRDIVAPDPKLKASLRELNFLLQKLYDNTNIDFQIAYKKTKNIKDGAKIHLNNKYVFNMDLHNFFPSCTKELVIPYIRPLFNYAVNYENNINLFLNTILMNDALFIGSPISGTLANAIISEPVNYMKNICKKYDMECSVYADDITFSSNKFIPAGFAENIVRVVFEYYNIDSNFALNKSKSVGFTGHNRKITGVSINNNNKITIRKGMFMQIRTELHHLACGDINVNIPHLKGLLSYATMLDDSGKLYRYLQKFLPTVQTYKLVSDKTMNELKNRAGI